MKKKKLSQVSLIVSILICVLTVFPLSAMASTFEKVNLPTISNEYNLMDITPSANEISANPNYSEGFINMNNFDSSQIMASTINGSCSITKVSSSSVNISGYTTCSPSSPSVEVILQLQAYYDGAWHTLKSKSKSQSGTRVDLTQGYSVTSGYYYRVHAIHSTADGTTKYSTSNSINVE